MNLSQSNTAPSKLTGHPTAVGCEQEVASSRNKSHLEVGRTASRIPPEVTALLSALQLRRPDTSLLKELSDREWASLLDFSDRAQLTLPIAQLPMMGFPPWVAERLRTNLADNALRFDRIKATYREVAEALEHAGVEHVVIKGFTQAPDYVGDPRLRSQSDIDIFCPPESIATARRALEAIGYRSSGAKHGLACADHGAALIRLGDWLWRGNPFDPEMPLSIELHFCLWNESVSQIHAPETGFFWKRRTRRWVDSLSFPCLCPVDHFGYLTLHILRNLFLGEWIVHHVRELAVFLHSRADDESFWKTWSETHSPSLRTFEAIALYHARAWFNCRMHPLAELEIESLPGVRQSWLKRFSGSALAVMFEQNKDRLWLQLTFLYSRSEKWKVLKRTLIPARIAPIGSPAVQVRNKRLVQSRGSNLLGQFFAYLISRSASHSRASLTTLSRALLWRLSEVALGRIPRRVKAGYTDTQ